MITDVDEFMMLNLHVLYFLQMIMNKSLPFQFCTGIMQCDKMV